MNILFSICAVLSAAVFVNAFDFANFGAGNDAIDDIKKCIQDGYDKVADAHPDLKAWFDDINAVSQNITDKAERCRKLPVLAQRRCLNRVNRLVRREYIRLFGNMTEEQKVAYDEMEQVAKDCFADEKDTDVDESPRSPFNRITTDQVKCLAEGYYNVVTENPELKSWFADFRTIQAEIEQEADECEALSGFAEIKCYIALAQSVQQKINSLLQELQGVQQSIVDQIKQVNTKCVGN